MGLEARRRQGAFERLPHQTHYRREIRRCPYSYWVCTLSLLAPTTLTKSCHSSTTDESVTQETSWIKAYGREFPTLPKEDLDFVASFYPSTPKDVRRGMGDAIFRASVRSYFLRPQVKKYADMITSPDPVVCRKVLGCQAVSLQSTYTGQRCRPPLIGQLVYV